MSNDYLKIIEKIFIETSTMPSAYISPENTLIDKIFKNILENIFGGDEQSFNLYIKTIAQNLTFDIHNIDFHYLTIINEIIWVELEKIIKDKEIPKHINCHNLVKCVKIVKSYPLWDKDERFLEMSIRIDNKEFIRNFNKCQSSNVSNFFVNEENLLNYGTTTVHRQIDFDKFYTLEKSGVLEQKLNNFKTYILDISKTHNIILEAIKILNNKILKNV